MGPERQATGLVLWRQNPEAVDYGPDWLPVQLWGPWQGDLHDQVEPNRPEYAQPQSPADFGERQLRLHRASLGPRARLLPTRPSPAHGTSLQRRFQSRWQTARHRLLRPQRAHLGNGHWQVGHVTPRHRWYFWGLLEPDRQQSWRQCVGWKRKYISLPFLILMSSLALKLLSLSPLLPLSRSLFFALARLSHPQQLVVQRNKDGCALRLRLALPRWKKQLHHVTLLRCLVASYSMTFCFIERRKLN